MPSIAAQSFRPHLTHALIVKVPRLLPMWYSLSDLEAEAGVPIRTLRDWLLHDLPHRRDQSGHIWIDGTQFASWVSQKRKLSHRPMGSSEAYCLRCRKVVPLNNTSESSYGNRILLRGTCPSCGSGINRGAHRG